MSLDNDAGALARSIAEASARIARDNAPSGLVRREGYVIAVGDNGTLDVNIGSTAKPQKLAAIKMTTSCVGVRTGDRVLVETLDSVSYAVAVIANSSTVARAGGHFFCGSATTARYVRLGTLTMPKDGRSCRMTLLWGEGFNGQYGQNGPMDVYIRSGNNTGSSFFGITVMHYNKAATTSEVFARASDSSTVTLYVRQSAYSNLDYWIDGDYTSWAPDHGALASSPGDLNVSIGWYKCPTESDCNKLASLPAVTAAQYDKLVALPALADRAVANLKSGSVWAERWGRLVFIHVTNYVTGITGSWGSASMGNLKSLGFPAPASEVHAKLNCNNDPDVTGEIYARSDGEVYIRNCGGPSQLGSDIVNGTLSFIGV